jgi:serine/threonine-protein kinase
VEPSAAGLKPGSSLGAYTVLKSLGSGGMALVYLAQHAALGRLVAIKVLRNEMSGNAEAVQRFFLEARAVNQIRHPHIVEITDFCANEGGEAYYVMEFLEGRDVEALLAKHPLKLLRGLEIARQAASAVGAVHDAGIVHRDLKSANIFVTTDADGNDWVKLLDFGIAKINDANGKRIGDTLAGVAFGTPEFVSPEQATAKEVDHRSDIYSFGVFLYHIATGRIPFSGDSTNDILRRQVYEKPRAPRRLKGLPHPIPPALDHLIMRCLAKKPADRPQSMKEIQPELAMIADTARYEMELRSRRVWRVAVAATLLLALVTGSAATDAMSGRTPGRTVRTLAVSAYRAIKNELPRSAAARTNARPVEAAAPSAEVAEVKEVPEFQPDPPPIVKPVVAKASRKHRRR